MAKLEWDKNTERLYETGVDQVALFIVGATGEYGEGIAWNGVTAVNETPSGADATALYADNTKYLTLRSLEELGITIEAYTYPPEFGVCDGSAEYIPGVYVGQQKRQTFGLAYRTNVGNDTDGDAHGHKLHLVYGCTASPSERSYSTINDSPEAITFSWECETTPIDMTDLGAGLRKASIITIDETVVGAESYAKVEAMVYGGTAAAKLPLPSDIKTLLAQS